MVIVAVIQQEAIETIVGVSQYGIDSTSHSAEVAFVVRDDYQNKGIGSELVHYLTFLAKTAGLLGFTAEVLVENRGMLHLFVKTFPELQKRMINGVYELKMHF